MGAEGLQTEAGRALANLSREFFKTGSNNGLLLEPGGNRWQRFFSLLLPKCPVASGLCLWEAWCSLSPRRVSRAAAAALEAGGSSDAR